MVEPKPKKAPETTEVKEEEPTVKTTSILEEPSLTVEDNSKTLTPTEFIESLAELKDKAKAAGIRPIQNMVTSYLSQGLAMVDGLLESLEGKKKKGK